MTSNIINFKEAEYFYKNPHSLVDFTQMQSFSLIKSCIEVFNYYNIREFTADDVKVFFEKISIIQAKNNRAFIPSAKKISGVMDCCLQPSDCFLEKTESGYKIVRWNSDGYKYEIMYAKDNNLI